MPINFTPVARNTPTAATGNVDPEIVEAYQMAAEFFGKPENAGKDLYSEFESEDERNAFVKYARATAPQARLRFRASQNAKGEKTLRFRIETEQEYQARKAEREAADQDREARRAAGEEIKRGRAKKSA